MERPNPEGGTHCVCIRNTAEVGGVCVNREGPIGGVSEGIAAQVTLCAAFGGEVLATEEVLFGEIAAGLGKNLDDSIIANAMQFHPSESNALRLALRDWIEGDADYWNKQNLSRFQDLDLLGAVNLAVGGVAGIDTTGCTGSVQNRLQCVFDQVPQVPNSVEDSAEAVPYGCRGVDKSGTFCLLGSLEVFPCRGLFTRARDCNIKYNRPLLNPFLCAPSCPPPLPPAAPLANR